MDLFDESATTVPMGIVRRKQPRTGYGYQYHYCPVSRSLGGYITQAGSAVATCSGRNILLHDPICPFQTCRILDKTPTAPCYVPNAFRSVRAAPNSDAEKMTNEMNQVTGAHLGQSQRSQFLAASDGAILCLNLRLRSQPDDLTANGAPRCDDGHLGVAWLVGMHMRQKCSHRDEARNGKDVN